MLGAKRAVLDLDHEPQAAFRDHHRMHTFGADLRDQAPVRFFRENRIEAFSAADEERAIPHPGPDARARLRAIECKPAFAAM